MLTGPSRARLVTLTLALLLIVHFGKGREKGKADWGAVAGRLNGTHRRGQAKNYSSASLEAFNELNRTSSESQKPPRPKAVLPFTGLTQSNKLNKHCCQNGGTCILGSFCACPRHFSGRNCELDERQSKCGAKIEHGDWVRRDCQLCRCFYGTLHCFTEPTQENCDPVEENDAFIQLYSGAAPLQTVIFFFRLLPILVLYTTGLDI